MSIIVVTGGASSGKSAYAERVACELPGPHAYLATMRAYGAEGAARVERHRKLRAGKGFQTVERAHDLAGLQLPNGFASETGTVLLEDLGNLVANELFDPEGAGGFVPQAETFTCPPELFLAHVNAGIAHVAQQCAHLVVVANEMGADGLDPGYTTNAYRQAAGAVACACAARADAVVECAAGLPFAVKGVLPL